MIPVTVEPILFFYMMIIFMESNGLQELIYVKSCMKIIHPVNISTCSYALKHNNTEAMNEATLWSKYTNACLSLCTLFSAMYVGSWSDRFGRKFPMVIPPVGTVIAAFVNAFLSYYIEAHVAYFLVSAVISGITFGTVGIISSTYGFISDFTHEQSRTKRIVILESMIFIGGTIGIYVAGAFLKDAHYNYVLNSFVQLFLFEALLSAAIIVYTIFRIPSSHASEMNTLHRPMSCIGLFSLEHITDSLRTVFRFREDGKRKKVILMLTALFLIYFGNVVQLYLGYYFVKEELLWSFQKYSNYHSALYAVEGFALIIILPVVLRFFLIPDHFVGIIGLISRASGHIVLGLSTNDYMVYSCVALFIFSEFPVPALRSMLSKIVDPDEKGRIFAFTTLLQTLCFLFGSLVLMSVFTASWSPFHGFCFEVVAILQGIALIILGYLYWTRNTLLTVYETVENDDGSTTEICSVVSASDSVTLKE